VTTSSLLGVWNGVSLLFADWTRAVRLPHGRDIPVGATDGRDAARESAYDSREAERSLAFRAFLIWLTVPPMALLFLDKPFGLTLVYGVLGAAFMPFLSVTLLLLLNARRVGEGGRSGWLSNLLLAGSTLLFVVILVNEVKTQLS
jgi:hypothetical protein